MLSRAAILSGHFRPVAVLSVRATASTPANQAAEAVATAASDKSNLPRPVRQEPGKVRMGFVPEEWFTFFYKKTGVTGPYTLMFTLGTYLVSKEIYVLEHEYYGGLSFLLMWIFGVKKFGPALAKYLDKEIDKYEKDWNEGRENEKVSLANQIKEEEKNQWSMEGQNLLVQAKKENVGLQLEAAYRERLSTVYNQVVQRLEYQVTKQAIERRVAQKNLVEYVVAKVKASITPDQEKQNIDRCIADLAGLAKA